MKLKEITIQPPGGSYASEFFADVATRAAGKLFAYEKPISRNSLSTQAATYGKKLGVRFTVRSVPPTEVGKEETYAVGVSVTEPRTRKPRTATEIEVQPALETWPGKIDSSDQLRIGDFYILPSDNIGDTEEVL